MRLDKVLASVVLLTGGGCALLDPFDRGTKQDDRPAACASVPLGGAPVVVGAEAALRERLDEAMKAGIVAVRYVDDSCAPVLEVLDDCRAPGRYVYEAAFERRTIVANAPEDRLRDLPFLAAPLRDEAKLVAELTRAGRLRAPEATRHDRAGLIGDGCDGATHLAMTIDVGGYGVASNVAPNAKVFVKPSPPGALAEGDPEDCAVAERRARRTPGCVKALALSFVPISEETIELGPVAIPAGDYQLGDEKVALTAYVIDRREVTTAAYAACVAAGACTPAREGPRCTTGVLGREQHPQNCVSFEQAEKFCSYARKRLPSEAEWERAARGTDGRAFAWGDVWPPPEGAANLADANAKSKAPHWATIEGYVDGFAETAPVGALVAYPAPSGMTGAAGNVMEWTSDWYDRRKRARVVRGSSFGHARREQIEVTSRSFYDPTLQSVHIGIRCAASSEG